MSAGQERVAAYSPEALLRDVLGYPVNGEYSRELALRALDDLLAEIERLREIETAAAALIHKEDVRLGDLDQIRLSNALARPC